MPKHHSKTSRSKAKKERARIRFNETPKVRGPKGFEYIEWIIELPVKKQKQELRTAP